MAGGTHAMKSSGEPAHALWDDSFRRTMNSLFHGDIHWDHHIN